VQQQAELKQAKQELANMIIQGTATEKKLLLAVAEMKMNFDKARRSADIVDQGLSENDKRKVSIDFNIAKNDLFLAREKIKFHQRNQPVNLRLAQGKVDRALIKVASLKQDIEKLNIKAPLNGIVVYRSNWRGEKPAVGESVSFGRPILEVAVLDKMQLTAEIAEVDSGKLRIGQSVEIKLDGVQGQVFQGKLISTGSVFREKSRQDKRRICDAIIEFNQTNGDIMRPGMTARIDIVTETINDAVTVSSAAVRQAGGRSTVTVAGMFYQTQKDIEITHIVDGKAVVSNGLIPGEKVLL
jgi:HlyD family secretion protein